jgi:phosphatidylinositol alpha-1,6-mannosyltransferase
MPSSSAALMLGRLARTEFYKGHQEMILAWRQVVGAVPQAELWIAGEGDLRPGLERETASLGLANSVRFFGRVSEDYKAQLMAQCRCFALPSHGEGFGLVYLEAMRLGRPCLVSNRDAGREVINPPEAGSAIDPQQIDQLTGEIVDMMTDDGRWNAVSSAARLRYEAMFTASHFQDRLLKAIYGSPGTT